MGTLARMRPLEIAVPAGNPADVRSLEDLGRPGLALVLCAPAVPCGAAATELEDSAGIDLSPSSEEQSVAGVLGKVVSGEADAGLVYVTDVRAAGDEVEGIQVGEADGVVNHYPIATVSGSENSQLGKAFLDLVTGDRGQQVLAAAGFGHP